MTRVPTNDELKPLLKRGYRYAAKLTRDPHEAEDLLQEAWASILRSGRVVEERLLMVAIKSRHIDRLRKARQAELESIHDLPVRAQGNTPSGTAADRERVDEAFDEMRSFERHIFYLHVVEGYSAAEVADLCGRPRNSVLVAMHRARRRLQSLLAPATEAAR